MLTTSRTQQPAEGGNHGWLARVDEGGPAAAFIVAFSGLYSAAILNMLPAFVSAWSSTLGASEQSIGFVATANLIAHALGILLALLLVWRMSLPRIAAIGLALAILGDLASVFAHTTGRLAMLRVICGLGLGLQYGAVTNWFGRSDNAARGFAAFVMLQFIISAASYLLVPYVQTVCGNLTPYVVVAPLAASAILCMPALGLHGGLRPLREATREAFGHRASSLQRGALVPTLFTLLAFGVFNVAAMGVWSYMDRYGRVLGLSSSHVSDALALGSISGIPGGLIVWFLGKRSGVRRPLLAAIVIFSLPLAAFAFGHVSPAAFYIGQAAIGLAWTMIVPYFQEILSVLDPSGRLSIIGMLAAAVAAAFGPAAIGYLIGQANYRMAFAGALGALVASSLLAARAASAVASRN